jgi:hypothetical protein
MIVSDRSTFGKRKGNEDAIVLNAVQERPKFDAGTKRHKNPRHPDADSDDFMESENTDDGDDEYADL